MPAFGLLLPVRLSNEFIDLVFGYEKDLFPGREEDFLLNLGRKKRHARYLVDPPMAHVEMAGELLDVVYLAAVQKLFDLVG